MVQLAGSTTMSVAPHAGAILTIDLQAVRWNYRFLRGKLGARVRCGAVLKADAYGLGAHRIGPVLHAEGCRDFFVAHLEEGLRLLPHVPESSIYILNGLPNGAEADCARVGLIPVLNSFDQCRAWAEYGSIFGRKLPAVIQFDSGMNRLGMTQREIDGWVRAETQFSTLDIRFVMSHLACAEVPLHPANAMQLAKFERLSEHFSGLPRSLANSSGIFHGRQFHYDVVRPGAALYGINPIPTRKNTMRAVIQLAASVIQTRKADKGDHVGYGWDFRISRPTRLATLSVGYGDGLHRVLGNGGAVYFEGRRLPIVGRVSMDSITVDISELESSSFGAGSRIEVIGAHQSIDDLAEASGTIGYEILTALGHRYERNYLDAAELSRAELIGELQS